MITMNGIAMLLQAAVIMFAETVAVSCHRYHHITINPAGHGVTNLRIEMIIICHHLLVVVVVVVVVVIIADLPAAHLWNIMDLLDPQDLRMSLMVDLLIRMNITAVPMNSPHTAQVITNNLHTVVTAAVVPDWILLIVMTCHMATEIVIVIVTDLVVIIHRNGKLYPAVEAMMVVSTHKNVIVLVIGQVQNIHHIALQVHTV